MTREQDGYVAQLNRALDFGSSGRRFESCRGHIKQETMPFGMVLCFQNKSKQKFEICEENKELER